jgi:hypothetical protein
VIKLFIEFYEHTNPSIYFVAPAPSIAVYLPDDILYPFFQAKSNIMAFSFAILSFYLLIV